jgi:hypothetical protein
MLNSDILLLVEEGHIYFPKEERCCRCSLEIYAYVIASRLSDTKMMLHKAAACFCVRVQPHAELCYWECQVWTMKGWLERHSKQKNEWDVCHYRGVCDSDWGNHWQAMWRTGLHSLHHPEVDAVIPALEAEVALGAGLVSVLCFCLQRCWRTSCWKLLLF